MPGRYAIVLGQYSGPLLYCPHYIATFAYLHEIVKNGFSPCSFPRYNATPAFRHLPLLVQLQCQIKNICCLDHRGPCGPLGE